MKSNYYVFGLKFIRSLNKIPLCLGLGGYLNTSVWIPYMKM